MKTKKDKIEKTNMELPYLTLQRNIFEDETLSITAKMLIMYMQNNKDGFEFRAYTFANLMKISKTTVQKTVNELKKKGLLKTTKIPMGNCGGFKTEYTLTFTNTDVAVIPFSVITETVSTETVSTENEIYNKNKLNENKLNKNKFNKSDSGSDNSSSNRENFLVGTTETESEFELNKKLIEKEIEFENQINALREAENKKTIDNTIQPKELNQSDKTKQKKDYFFQVGERPGLNKINEYINQKGYNQSAADSIHKKLSDSNYKDAAGNQIRYIQSWIDKELNNYTPSINGTEIEQLTIEMADIYTSSLPEEQHCYYHTNRVKLKEAVQLGIEVLGQVKTRKAVVNAINAAKQKGIAISPSSFFKTFKNEMEKAGTTYTTTTTKELTAV